jgi:hypothetical protein
MSLGRYVLASSTAMHWIALGDQLPGARLLCSPDYGGDFLARNRDVLADCDGLVAVFFDGSIEALLDQMGVPICFPPSSVRAALEDKCEAVRLAQAAGVPVAPTCLAKITGYVQLRSLAEAASLGQALVVQLPKGNSGKGTFAIRRESDYAAVADRLEAAGDCRIMQELPSPQSYCIETVLTDAGPVIGLPALDLVGIPELTPNPDGWCGNVIGAGVVHPTLASQMRANSLRVAGAVQQLHPDFFGYSGDDYLLPANSQQLVYQEKNARCTGMIPLSNLAAHELGVPPLLLQHLLQFQGGGASIDVDGLNRRWSGGDGVGVSSCLIIKQLGSGPAFLRHWPRPGLYALDSGSVRCLSHSIDALPLLSLPGRALWIPETPGGTLQPQDILGRLLVRGRVTDGNALNGPGHAWIAALRAAFVYGD